jgi:hypothetical protein
MLENILEPTVKIIETLLADEKPAPVRWVTLIAWALVGVPFCFLCAGLARRVSRR